MAAARAFHKLVQAEWQDERLELQGDPEFPLIKDTGRRGRADVHVLVEELDKKKKTGYLSFVEVKHTFWVGKPEKSIRRLISRYARQLYSYMDGCYKDGESYAFADKTLGIVFPRRPETERLAETIEEGFGEFGISVVWHDDK